MQRIPPASAPRLVGSANTGKLVANTPLPVGKVHIALEFVPDAGKTMQTPPGLVPQPRPAPGIAKLWINGTPAGSGAIAGFGGQRRESGYRSRLEISRDAQLCQPVHIFGQSRHGYGGFEELKTLPL